MNKKRMHTEHKIDLFNEDPIQELRMLYEILKKGYDNVRRGQFARISALGTLILQQQKEIDDLKQQLIEIRKSL